MFKAIVVFNFVIVFPFLLMAGITGKITGHVTDEQTGAPLMGVNIILAGTAAGAATDLNGYYVILNVPPGNYDIKVSMIGYQEVQLNDVPVHTDFTSTENFALKTRVLESGEEVIVIGSRPDIQRDRTSTMAVIGADAISKMPVTEFKELINLQAGVVDGHFRGGRAGEVSYMLDGISVSDPFDGEMAVEIENSSIQEVKVISGTFSAEYGQAMSGVVNIITKTGTDRYSISADLYTGDYLSGHDSPFYNIGDFNPLGEKSGEITLAGPLPVLPEASFFVSARRLEADGYLYGVREFLPSDSSNLDDPNPANWYIERSGDGLAVSLNPFEKLTFNSKMAFKVLARLTLELQGSFSDQEWKTYNYLNYFFKYNPDGIATQYQDRHQFSVSLTHVPRQNLFYTLKFNQLYNNYESYVYKDPQDENYVSPILLRRLGYGFYMGGMDMSHFYRNSRVNTLKWNLISQANRRHEIKTGWELRQSNLWLHDYSLRLDRTTDWKPELYPPENVNNNEYRHIPVEFAFWLEDKMEFQRIILTLGLRWDYFHPDGVVPKDLRDPNGSYHGTADPYRDASDKHQWSPRLGISYPITARGAIHISYGHFFQIPNFEYLYHNSEFEVQGGSLSSIIGNADLDPTKTTIYQVGLQQMLLPGLVMELTGYYKDIRNLVGTQIKELYILGDSYARYINRDYGNVRGIALSLTQNPIGMLSGSIDYTYQVAEGNASDPDAVFYDQQSDPPRESETQTVPLDWDQTHTLNVSVNLSQKNWSTGLIASLGSGLPYTPEFQNQRTSFENSERRPYTFNIDLNAKYHFKTAGASWTLYVQVKNLFDRLNATDVFTDTGDPAYSLVPTYVPEQSIHTLDDFLTRPDFYMSPRKVIFGIKVNL